MEKKPTQAPKAPAQAFAKQEMLRQRQEEPFTEGSTPLKDNPVPKTDRPSPQPMDQPPAQPMAQESREPLSRSERAQKGASQRQMPRQPMIRQQQERKTLTESSPETVGERFSEEPGRVPRSVFTEPISSSTIPVPVSTEQGRSGAGSSHTATASTFRPVETANPAPSHSDGSKKMARSHAAQHTVKRVQAGVEKVKEEVNGQPDLSPSEFPCRDDAALSGINQTAVCDPVILHHRTSGKGGI